MASVLVTTSRSISLNGVSVHTLVIACAHPAHAELVAKTINESELKGSDYKQTALVLP